MLRFIFVCSVLISTSGVLAQKRTYSPSVNRILVPANSINPAQNTDERESKIRLHQLIDSIESRQGATGAKNDKEYGEKKSPAVSVLSNPEDVISQRMNKEAAAICYDTSSRFFFKNDSYRLFPHAVFKTADGNLLVAGECFTKSPPWLWGGFLMKCDEYGNRLWARRYDSADHIGDSYISYSKLIELNDGSIVLAGRTNNLVTENDDVIVTKTDNMGLIQWSKVYKSRLWAHGNGSRASYALEDLEQDPYSGDLFISGGFWEAGKSVIRINSSNGQILWSNLYQYSNNGYQVFDHSFGMTFEPNEIRLFGTIGVGHTLITVHRINKATGDTLSAKLFTTGDPLSYNLEFLTCESVMELDNGNYVLTGECYDDYPMNYDPPTRALHHTAVVELNRSLDFVRAYTFKSQVQSNVYDTRMTTFPDGSGLFTMREWLNPYNAKFYYVQFQDGFITRQRKRTYVNEGIAFETNAIRLKDGGDLLIRAIDDSLQTNARVEFLKLHTSDTSSACLGVDDTSTSIYSFKYVPAFRALDSIGHNVFLENPDKTITENTFNNELLPGCYQVSHCDSLKLVAPVSTICLGQELSVIARKNEDCGTIVPFSFDYSAANAVRDNDSTLRFQFKQPWSGYIYASLQGCNLMKDSVYVTVLKAPATLNLGPGKSLCPGNTIVLNAHKGYASYLWQDGSTDSVFTVTKAGLYYVMTTDACGGIYRDTLTISSAPPIAFDAGPDRTKCNDDTLHLNAPAGFLNYQWSNNYDISSTTGQNIVVNPLTDTAYYLKAEKTIGCFAYDTVRVHVNTSPPINLGADRSFCSGDSAVFDAGSGFNQYEWSNGGSSPQIIVKTAGAVSVMGITSQGCRSYDTVSVVNVFSNPVVSLDHTDFLCTGSPRILDAGTFASYQWNDGTTSQKMTVRGTGTYAVQVTDNHGCRGSDTTTITTILPLPSDFLPGDTLLCSYDKLIIAPLRPFSAYQWSNGASASSVNISQPGTYWLQVKDAKGCTGRDSIIINPKDCMKGFYVPTAFSPNNDGRNDLFRPMLFGHVKKYHFVIYSRWGQVLFETTELNRDWDGTVAGTLQQSNVYTWMCTYQFEGEEVKMEKGTVMLMR
jgi:gliding motility-associated-like protein